MLRINTFVYFSGIPWEDNPSSSSWNPFSSSLVADAVDIGYVFGNPTITPAEGLIKYADSSDMVGGDTPIPLNYTSTMFEYGWCNPNNLIGGCGTSINNIEFGVNSGYYVMLPEPPRVYFNFDWMTEHGHYIYNGTYYYGGSGNGGSDYYFLEVNANYETGDVSLNGVDSNNYIPFAPLDQRYNGYYLYYGIFYTYYWYTLQNGQVNTYFLVNGNIYNNQLPQSYYRWNCGFFGCSGAYAILPEPPAGVYSQSSPLPFIVQSYQNAYETAFVAEGHYALNNYPQGVLSYTSLAPQFVDGTFGYTESYGSVGINYLSANAQYYQGQPYLFISTGSGGGSGYMYLDWVIATFGVPYEINVP